MRFWVDREREFMARWIKVSSLSHQMTLDYWSHQQESVAPLTTRQVDGEIHCIPIAKALLHSCSQSKGT